MSKHWTIIVTFLGTTFLGSAALIFGTQLSRHGDLGVQSSLQTSLGLPLQLAQFQVPSFTPPPSGRPDRPVVETLEEKMPTGGLFLSHPADPNTDAELVFPLKHTDVDAQIQGNVARVEVTQTFENPFDEPLEAVYVFPLPDEAAVDGMEITIGDRTIIGDIKEREEAQAIYEEAIDQGRTAGLLEQERANIFTQSLANIRPGEQIDVTIRYTESLTFEGNNYEFVFPMVVGPRYIPGNPTTLEGDTDQVPDASRITPPVLGPGMRSGHDIAVTVDIDAGVPIQTIESPSHKIQMTPDHPSNGSMLTVELAPNDTIPNKDLILRYQMGGDTTQTTVLTDTTDQGGHFALYLIPALDYDTSDIVPKDVVFLMDTSGSQSGDPLAKSQELMRRMVNGLNPDDTFSIIDFANTTTRLSPVPLENTNRNRSRALDYINGLTANGGTELLNGIREVLQFPAAERDRLRSIVLLTDGYIGNESDVIAEVQRELADGNRLYSFGVGSGVNRFLIDRLAEVGRGTSQVIRHDEPTEEAAERFFQQIKNPVLTNIEVEWQGAGESPEIYPLAAPDLFANQPLVIFGRKSDAQNGTLNITGTMAGGDRYEQSIPVSFNSGEGNGAIAQLWGRARIKSLMNDMYGGETVAGVEAVTETALAYRLLSQYTAFVAVSEEVRVDPDGTRRTVQVPVELPEGVSYEGIFGPDATVNAGQFSATSRLQGSANFAPPARAAAGASRSGGSASPPMPSADLGIPAQRRPGISSGGNVPTQPSVIIAPEPEEFEQDDGLEQLERLSGIEFLEVMGLDDSLEPSEQEQLEISLAQHLSYALNATLEASETVTWQVRIRNGRVTQVLWDEENSTDVDQDTLDELRRSLQSWQLENDVDAHLTLTLEW